MSSSIMELVLFLLLSPQGMLAVWQLSSLIMVNVWASGSGVSDFTLAKGTTNILEGRMSRCSDRVYFIKESADEKVSHIGNSFIRGCLVFPIRVHLITVCYIIRYISLVGCYAIL